MRRFHSIAVLRESTIWHSCDTSVNWVPEILHQFSQVASSKLSTQPECIADLEGSPTKLFKLLLNWNSPKARRGEHFTRGVSFQTWWYHPLWFAVATVSGVFWGVSWWFFPKRLSISTSQKQLHFCLSIYGSTTSNPFRKNIRIWLVSLLTFLFKTFRFPSEH